MSDKKIILTGKRRFPIRQTPELLSILLKDRSTKRNIVWATDSYIGYGKNFLPQAEIKDKIIAEGGEAVVQPRMKKHVNAKSIRTKEKAEVFTPMWIVKKQNDLIEKEFENLKLDDYVEKRWLELTCGEAPYICSRYDSVTGEPITINKRVGFLDRKIQRISEEVDDQTEWIRYVEKALESTYGYEYHGDSLFIARENVLYTVIDYHLDKFNEIPELDQLKNFATIISYNIFQMDGLKYTVPHTEVVDVKHKDIQLNLFEEVDEIQSKEVVINEGKKVIVKDWKNNKIINFEEISLGGKVMKFDVVIGNPPYQQLIENREEQPAIYHKFIDASYKISDITCLITPARFLFKVGSTPKEWNDKMLSNPNVKVVFFTQESDKVFSNTDIKGGVAITYRNRLENYGSIGTFTVYSELNSIAKKVENHQRFQSLSTILFSNTSYKYSQKLFQDHPEFKNRLSGGSRRYATSSVFDVLPEIFFDKKPEDNKHYIKIYGRQNNQRLYKYVNRDYFQAHPNLDKYKVFVASSNGSGRFGELLSSPIVAKPGIGATETFISFGSFSSYLEAENLLKYLHSKFSRAMLSVLKVTHGNKTKHVWSKVPIQDFTNNSDIDWTKDIAEIDQQLYAKYNLSEEEIEFIENNVKEMK